MASDEAREKFIRSYLTEDEISRLITEARKGLDAALPTYSQFFVGACLLTHDGEYIMGCNIENISYSQSVHAEGCCISKAISAGKKNFKAVAVCGRSANFDAFLPPCGECRQFLNEFVNFLPIIFVHETGCLMYEMLHELLPLSVILGADIPVAKELSMKYDSILFHANRWLMKDTHATTRNQMRQLLRDWKFDEIHELTKEKLRFKEPGVLSGRFYTGPISINYNSVQHVFEAFCVVNGDLNENVHVSYKGDQYAETLAHRIVATLRSYNKSATLGEGEEKKEEGNGYKVHVESKGAGNEAVYEIKILDGKGSLITKETVEKIYEEREKLMVYRILSDYYDYNTNKLVHKGGK